MRQRLKKKIFMKKFTNLVVAANLIVVSSGELLRRIIKNVIFLLFNINY